MSVIERELKLELTESEFRRLLGNAKDINSPLIQTNYYFDTPSFDLANNGVTLRIRRENDEWFLCLKSKVKPADGGSPINTSIELQETVSEDIYLKCRNEPMRILDYLNEEAELTLRNAIKNDYIRILGSITNERFHVSLSEDYVMELDHSCFPGNIETYEAEVEGIDSPSVCEYILGCLSDMGVSIKHVSKSKYKRFVDALHYTLSSG